MHNFGILQYQTKHFSGRLNISQLSLPTILRNSKQNLVFPSPNFSYYPNKIKFPSTQISLTLIQKLGQTTLDNLFKNSTYRKPINLLMCLDSSTLLASPLCTLGWFTKMEIYILDNSSICPVKQIRNKFSPKGAILKTFRIKKKVKWKTKISHFNDKKLISIKKVSPSTCPDEY